MLRNVERWKKNAKINMGSRVAIINNNDHELPEKKTRNKRLKIYCFFPSSVYLFPVRVRARAAKCLFSCHKWCTNYFRSRAFCVAPAQCAHYTDTMTINLLLCLKYARNQNTIIFNIFRLHRHLTSAALDINICMNQQNDVPNIIIKWF